MTLQKKILNHLFLVFCAFSLMIILYVIFEQRSLRELWKDEKNNHQEVLNKLITLKSEALYTLSYDYTYWDDMVEFMSTRDETWAKENLEASLATYKTNTILVYNLQGEPVYTVNDLAVDNAVFLSAIPKDISALFAANPLCHFFVQTNEGLLEIRGATIHKTSDPERLKERYGYFFAGRLWNKELLQELSLLAGASVELVVTPGKVMEKPSGTTIVLTYNLPGWNKVPVGELRANVESLVLQNSIKKSNQILVLFIFFSFIISILVMTFLIRWIVRPLSLISTALETEDPISLAPLERNQTEFGRLAKLIKQFFAQKDTLLKEINERKKVQQNLGETQFQLLQSEKMASIGYLAAGVAHEINNPMGYIASNIESLEEYLRMYNEIFKYIPDLKSALEAGNTNRVADTIVRIETAANNLDLDFLREDATNLLMESQKGIERIKSIVADLKTFARADDKTKKYTTVESIIDSVLGIVENEIKYKVDLIKEYSKTPTILCHPQQLGQVFINLLVNAAQAIEKRGTITIKTFSEGGMVCVAFTDTGKGIPPENLTKIFDPFFTTKPVGKGTGLGLSISYDIIQKAGGTIKVQSEVDKGTTFTILIPQEDKADHEA